MGRAFPGSEGYQARGLLVSHHDRLEAHAPLECRAPEGLLSVIFLSVIVYFQLFQTFMLGFVIYFCWDVRAVCDAPFPVLFSLFPKRCHSGNWRIRSLLMEMTVTFLF